MPVPAFLAACVIALATIGHGDRNVQASRDFAEVRSTGFEQFEQEVVIPVEIPASNRHKRDTSDSSRKRRFTFNGFDEHFHLEVTSASLLAPGFRVYHRNGTTKDSYKEDGCLFQGRMRHRPDTMAALNLCGGMSGLLKTESANYLIEPIVHNNSDGGALEKPHLLKKRSLSSAATGDNTEDQKYCGKRKKYMPRPPRRKNHWLPGEFEVSSDNSDAPLREKRSLGRSRRHRNVETLVVADREMVKKHGSENVTSYLLTVFNMVAMLYQDSTIGNNVSVILVGLVLLEGDEPGLSLSHNAEYSLSSFCQWQSTVLTARGRKQHDHAVLVTGLDICSWKNEPCDTLGYAPISGMCSKFRSCTVNEDTGLTLAFTVAHELGHSFGMLHDDQGSSPCWRRRGTLMSPTLSGLILWSECSRDSLAQFLESPRSLCLKNVPDSIEELQFPDILPGQKYDANTQCMLQHGTKFKLCKYHSNKNKVCSALFCQKNVRKCVTKNFPAAEGTPCGENKWCRKGECLDMDIHNVTDGGWSEFSEWSKCSRQCGVGIRFRERSCDSPPPSNGGSGCRGVEKEYQICSNQNCNADSPEYFNDNCATFNNQTVKGRFYKWKPYGKDLGALSRCRIYCVPDKEDLMHFVFSTKLQDGTSCSRNFSGVCIDGECRNVGCDGKIDSNISPDLCGVCNGDNSTCITVKENFNTNILTEGYHEVVRIPPNSRHINVYEERDSPTYFALQDGKGKYFLNENWTLNWPGRYSASGTMFSYRRWPGQPESLTSEGPTTEELVVQVILQKDDAESVINYEFVIPSTSVQWIMQNSSCSLTCGNGVLISSPVCATSKNQTLMDKNCGGWKKPDKRSFLCTLAPCPLQWHVGEWSVCDNFTCEQTRDVFCEQQDTKVSSDKCVELPRPLQVRECSRNKCAYTWHTGHWSKCRGSCHSRFQTRSVTCRAENAKDVTSSNCAEDARPPHRRTCKSRGCSRQSIWITGPWSQCDRKCGVGEAKRNVSCVKKDSLESSAACNLNFRPITRKKCSNSNCNFRRRQGCVDVYDWCPTSTDQRLCKLKFYNISCCIACREKLRHKTSS